MFERSLSICTGQDCATSRSCRGRPVGKCDARFEYLGLKRATCPSELFCHSDIQIVRCRQAAYVGFNQKLKRRHVHECKIGENDSSYKNLQVTSQAANRHSAMEVTYRNGLPKQPRIAVPYKMCRGFFRSKCHFESCCVCDSVCSTFVTYRNNVQYRRKEKKFLH